MIRFPLVTGGEMAVHPDEVRRVQADGGPGTWVRLPDDALRTTLSYEEVLSAVDGELRLIAAYRAATRGRP